MKEIWKDIEGYEGLYQVSNFGRIKSLGRKIRLKQYIKILDDKIMKPCLNKRGYLYIRLCKNSKYKAFRVHRLVAKAFIDNPNNKPDVNHIDFDRTNNRSTNLEWCFPIDNTKHSMDHLKTRHNVKTNTGERYIRYIKKSNAYKVTVFRHKTYSFNNIENAIKKRDELLREIQ